MLECVINISEGQDAAVLASLSAACGDALLDRHTDVDHHRSVFTLAGSDPSKAIEAARALTDAASSRIDIRTHFGVHPRLGVIDVVPFVALHSTPANEAAQAALDYARWVVETHSVPVFLYGDADPENRSLPDARRTAFKTRSPDLGPSEPHLTLGAIAVGARPPMVAINVDIDKDDLALAREIAGKVRERDGGLPGVRSLGFDLPHLGQVQVSMNIVGLEQTSIEEACVEVERLIVASGASVARIELVGLVPDAALTACSKEFLERSGLSENISLERRVAGREEFRS
ncbi:unannotated protein [freshwater metagenome]|uniref:glutamate formimidoyltransferase n=1 Tax=freshwater metagenome TaxID=449393 RepID=A0A6J7N546_9ZZZZ|nr:hypothetical protein [Actinomycetota bacterium]MSX82164.1 hypothetical protein [Actinomycetota bacterium]